MTNADVLNLAGLGFQLLGIAISARGLYHSWRDYAPAGERFLDPLHRVATGARERVRRVAARIGTALGRPPKAVTGTVAVSLGAVAMNARGRVGMPPLPDDPAKAIEQLDHWLRWTMEHTYEAYWRIEDALTEEHKARESLQAAVDKVRLELDAQDRDIAAGGARMAAVGLLVVLLGTVLQGVALFVA